MTDRWGATKITTIMRDFSALRTAIRSHDSEAAEAAWLNCERWVACVEARAVEQHALIAGWRAVLADLAEEVEAEARGRHGITAGRQVHPVTERAFQRDMISVDAARVVIEEMDAVLGEKG